ncbi:Lhr family helicase [Pseudofrankia inefficax]|uniref:DEAD/H associated domain protein n=1 Tax=Pseudofrankia inefficax (strain DSM 45817 / CECT 9037 / DDB 130130 / EuI1c) TaxID=298654 RepID=E3J131_PSEI1|nr:DEAD/DEAH box helicase [Pseudofrankia inefficax]ADP79209.1 DEAD/H associated domain protein [Pseudofrankia inefficax]
MPDSDPLAAFSAPTRAWFQAAFPAPTPAQAGAWAAVRAGGSALVVAPTGSGKTLAAFLWSLDELVRSGPPADPTRRCRVLYVSPLKALAVDVARNLRAPLAGIQAAATRLGQTVPEIRIGMRTGDTPATERRAFGRTPPDILITTPESLFLVLTSQAREALRAVETVIVDEVHAVASTKRGAHLALSLERLDALRTSESGGDPAPAAAPARRIGLSATVRPVEEVARFLGGTRPVTVVRPPARKTLLVDVVVPVRDMADPGAPDGLAGLTAPGGVSGLPTLESLADGPPAAEPAKPSIWPAVEARVLDLIEAHTSTIVFANSRRVAERLCARLNELHTERLIAAENASVHRGGGRIDLDGPPAGPPDGQSDELDGPLGYHAEPTRVTPAEVMGAAGLARGSLPTAEVARAHHGSVSREQRLLIEEDLKAGRLPAVVATSSLELGIDMGAVDLVVQISSPPSVAAGMQRVGRAGHQVGVESRGVVLPSHRADLLEAAVVAERMRDGAIEEARYPRNPLDVLAQQIVAMTAVDTWPVAELGALVRRAAPFATLPGGAFEAVLDMLSGRYPSDAFAELRPRIVWDRAANTVAGRPGAQRLAVTSGGTIPDRGLFGVFLVGEKASRVGELDEEMVYESRVGDVVLLGSSSWRIEEITPDRVLVTPAPGRPGRLPFWHGDSPGRPAELGRALGAFLRELTRKSPQDAEARLRQAGLDEWATSNLLAYLDEQREAAGRLSDDRTLVVERFRDELGDWRLAVHSPFGARVNAPWALAIAGRLRERYGAEVQVMHTDDGIVARVPDADAAPGAADVVFDPDEIAAVVRTEVGASALFASRFRECAGRALLLPRRSPGRRTPLWQQRQRSAALLSVAAGFENFPVVLETMRECLQDVFDVPALVELHRDVDARRLRVVEVETPAPSPFARSLLFGYVATFLYDGDAPLAERRAQMLSLDSRLLAELLGETDLRELIDPTALAEVEAELARLAPDRRARDVEGAADLLRVLGDLTTAEALARGATEEWLRALAAAGRALEVRIAGEERWVAVEDAGRLRDALGVPLPMGVPTAFTEPVRDPLGDLVSRFTRTRGPFDAEELAARFGLGVSVAVGALERLVGAGRLVRGELRPGRTGEQWCDAEVLRRLRRRSLAASRREVEAVPPRALGAFLPAWQAVTAGRSRGVDAVARAVEQLQGALIPASAWEQLVLPARVADYSPAMLDELCATGEVLWAGAGGLPGDDGWVTLMLADAAPLLLPALAARAGDTGEPSPSSRAATVDLAALATGEAGERPADGSQHPPTDDGPDLMIDDAAATPLHRAVLDALADDQALFFRTLSDRVGSLDDTALAGVIWDLVWAGLITNDTLAPLRARLSGGSATTHRAPPRPRRSTMRFASGYGAGLTGTGRGAGRPATPRRGGPPMVAGRWSLLPPRDTDPTRRAHALAETLLDRHGLVTRGAVVAERAPGGFAAVYRVLSAFEDAGRARRGYFVEGLGAAQFAMPGAVDRLRAVAATQRAADEEPDWVEQPGGITGALGAVAFPAPGGRAQPGARRETDRRAVVLAATDPANPYGAALPWPARSEDPDGPGHRPGRKAGALVVLVDGDLVLYVERGGKTLLSWPEPARALQPAVDALALAVRDGWLGQLAVERADGRAITGSALGDALVRAGFHPTPRGGLRLRG